MLLRPLSSGATLAALLILALDNLPGKYYLSRQVMEREADKVIREYLAKVGRKGGKARAAKYDKATLSRWAKKGGRPPKGKGDKQ